jgi:hypothetical protein
MFNIFQIAISGTHLLEVRTKRPYKAYIPEQEPWMSVESPMDWLMATQQRGQFYPKFLTMAHVSKYKTNRNHAI